MGAAMVRRLHAVMTFMVFTVCLAAALVAGGAFAHAADAANGGSAGKAALNDGAVVIMYHHFGRHEYPTTNITLDQFDAHIKELTSGRYHVMSLQQIVDDLRAGKRLPDHAVGIAVDDAYRSVFTEAWPRLKKAGLPLTVFVATGEVDNHDSNIMTWDQLRELKDQGVTIGNHTVTHPHMAMISEAQRKREMEDAQARYQKELGVTPKLFAYPYGEASLEIMKEVKAEGFEAAFGQHSGVINPTSNLYYLPRFALDEHYGTIDRVKLILNSLPLPVHDVTPMDPLITTTNPPLIGFTVADGLTGLDRMSCYASNQGKVKTERLDHRFEVRPAEAFPPGRTRVNCTLLAPDGRWRWFGRQYYVKP